MPSTIGTRFDGVLAAEERRISAVISGDIGVVSSLLHDDLVYVHSNGRIDDKPTYVTALGKRLADYRAIYWEERKVGRCVDGCILSGWLTMEMIYTGNHVLIKTAAVQLWQPDAGGWLLRTLSHTPRSA